MPKVERKKKYNLRKKSAQQAEEKRIQQLEDIRKDEWSTEEITAITEGILTHGHLSERVLSKTRGKSWKSYTKLFTQAAAFSRKQNRQHPPDFLNNLDNWISDADRICKNEETSNGPTDVAGLLKLLSMDGVVENHPLPEHANGVDFGACYRLLFQAILGFPLQPLNKETFKLFSEIFEDVAKCNTHERDLREKIKTFLNNPKENVNLPSMYRNSVELPQQANVKTYGRKKTSKTVPNPAVVNCTDQNVPNTDIECVLKDMLESTSYNPLKLQQEMLINLVLPPSYEIPGTSQAVISAIMNKN